MEIRLHHRVYWQPPDLVRKLYVSPHEYEMAKEMMRVLPGRVAEVRDYNWDNQEMLLEYVPDVALINEDHLTLVIRSLLEAVQTLHGAGYVHRDIHRSNFAITPTGIKLYDFESIQPRERCDLNILGHDYIEFEKEPADVARYLQTNDYFALSYALDELYVQNYNLELPLDVKELIVKLQETPESGSELIATWLDR